MSPLTILTLTTGRATSTHATSTTRTLYVRTADLYVIAAAGAVPAWRDISSTFGAQSKLHCSELAAVSGWCQWVYSVFRGQSWLMRMLRFHPITRFLIEAKTRHS